MVEGYKFCEGNGGYDDRKEWTWEKVEEAAEATTVSEPFFQELVGDLEVEPDGLVYLVRDVSVVLKFHPGLDRWVVCLEVEPYLDPEFGDWHPKCTNLCTLRYIIAEEKDSQFPGVSEHADPDYPEHSTRIV